MKRLYLDVNSKYEAWDAIVSIIESLREFQISLPDHLRKENVNAQSHNNFRQQTIFLDFYFNHTVNICCRPLLVRRQNISISAAVAQYRRSYCQSIAEKACNRIAVGINDARECGFVGGMLFSVSGICLSAAEVLALQAVALPKESPVGCEACQQLNNLLIFLAGHHRPGPLTGQTVSIMQDLVRIVNHINEQRTSGSGRSYNIGFSPQTTARIEELDPAIYGDSVFQPNLLRDFLDSSQDFPTFAMDDLIWMPGRSVNIWGEEQPESQRQSLQAMSAEGGLEQRREVEQEVLRMMPQP